MMIPTTLGLILPAFPVEQRVVAIGIWSAVGGVAAALGPPIGGLLVELSWRWIFLVNVPIGLVTAIVAWRALQEVREPEDGRPDLLGAAALALGIGLLTLGIVKGPEWGWLDPATLASFAGCGGADRRLRLPLRPPPRAGDRAAAAARALLRAWQPRLAGLLRRLRRDAALRRPPAHRSLGLLGAQRRPRPLPRPADGGALRGPLRAPRRQARPAPGGGRGRARLRRQLRLYPRHGRPDARIRDHLPARLHARRRRGRDGARRPARRGHGLAAAEPLRHGDGGLRDVAPARLGDRRRRPGRAAQRLDSAATCSPACNAAGGSPCSPASAPPRSALALGPVGAPAAKPSSPSRTAPDPAAAAARP